MSSNQKSIPVLTVLQSHGNDPLTDVENLDSENDAKQLISELDAELYECCSKHSTDLEDVETSDHDTNYIEYEIENPVPLSYLDLTCEQSDQTESLTTMNVNHSSDQHKIKFKSLHVTSSTNDSHLEQVSLTDTENMSASSAEDSFKNYFDSEMPDSYIEDYNSFSKCEAAKSSSHSVLENLPSCKKKKKGSKKQRQISNNNLSTLSDESPDDDDTICPIRKYTKGGTKKKHTSLLLTVPPSALARGSGLTETELLSDDVGSSRSNSPDSISNDVDFLRKEGTDVDTMGISEGEEDLFIPLPVEKKNSFLMPLPYNEKIQIYDGNQIPEDPEPYPDTDEDFQVGALDDDNSFQRPKSDEINLTKLPIEEEFIQSQHNSSSDITSDGFEEQIEEMEFEYQDNLDCDVVSPHKEDNDNSVVNTAFDDDILFGMEVCVESTTKEQVDALKNTPKLSSNESLTDVEEFEKIEDSYEAYSKIDDQYGTDIESFEDDFIEETSSSLNVTQDSHELSEIRFIESDNISLSIIITPEELANKAKHIVDSIVGVIFLNENDFLTDTEELCDPVESEQELNEKLDNNQRINDPGTDTEDFDGNYGDSDHFEMTEFDLSGLTTLKEEHLHIIENEDGSSLVNSTQGHDTKIDLNEEQQTLTEEEDSGSEFLNVTTSFSSLIIDELPSPYSLDGAKTEVNSSSKCKKKRKKPEKMKLEKCKLRNVANRPKYSGDSLSLVSPIETLESGNNNFEIVEESLSEENVADFDHFVDTDLDNQIVSTIPLDSIQNISTKHVATFKGNRKVEFPYLGPKYVCEESDYENSRITVLENTFPLSSVENEERQIKDNLLIASQERLTDVESLDDGDGTKDQTSEDEDGVTKEALFKEADLAVQEGIIASQEAEAEEIIFSRGLIETGERDAFNSNEEVNKSVGNIPIQKLRKAPPPPPPPQRTSASLNAKTLKQEEDCSGSSTAVSTNTKEKTSSEDEEQLMLMRDSPCWEDEEIQNESSKNATPIIAEIKLLVKTTDCGKESIEIRSIREFFDPAHKAEDVPANPKKCPKNTHIPKDISTTSPKFARSLNSSSFPNDDEFGLMAQVRDCGLEDNISDGLRKGNTCIQLTDPSQSNISSSNCSVLNFQSLPLTTLASSTVSYKSSSVESKENNVMSPNSNGSPDTSALNLILISQCSLITNAALSPTEGSSDDHAEIDRTSTEESPYSVRLDKDILDTKTEDEAPDIDDDILVASPAFEQQSYCPQSFEITEDTDITTPLEMRESQTERNSNNSIFDDKDGSEIIYETKMVIKGTKAYDLITEDVNKDSNFECDSQKELYEDEQNELIINIDEIKSRIRNLEERISHGEIDIEIAVTEASILQSTVSTIQEAMQDIDEVVFNEDENCSKVEILENVSELSKAVNAIVENLSKYLLGTNHKLIARRTESTVVETGSCDSPVDGTEKVLSLSDLLDLSDLNKEGLDAEFDVLAKEVTGNGGVNPNYLEPSHVFVHTSTGLYSPFLSTNAFPSVSTQEHSDVGVVFTEPKESWGGVKLPSETTSGQIHAQPIPSSHTFSPPLQDDSRPQRRHERTYSQASNIVSKNNYAASTETESSVESDIGPYSERKQFWEKVSSFESKSPFGKGETESDTDTGTDGTVIEKDLSFAEVSESAHESTEKKAEGRFGESKEASIPSDIHDLISVNKKEASRNLPSPDDISLKDVKTRKEVFEKEIQNQAAAAENGWKRSSKDYSDQHGIPEQKTQSITVESSITSKDSSFLREKEIIKLRLETESDMEKIKTRENTDREHSETTDSTSKELFSFKKVKEDEVETTTEQELKSDLRKQILEDEQENKKKTVTKSKDGLVTKSDAKETTKAYAETTHKEQDDKSQTFVKDKNGRESTVTFAEKSLHSSDRKEFHHSKAFTSHKKMRDISSEGDTSKTSSSETTESTDDSFDFNEATKKHTQAPQSHSECSTDDESKKIVEKKIEEERRTIGNIEEILVRETTTTREGDQEQRVVKETKTQETNLPDGSTVKTTSVTTFTTNLDTNDSDYSDGSSSAVLGREKLEGKLKQLSIDDVFPAELHSDELTPEDAGKKVLLSPIHIPEEENVEEVVWEVSQQVSEVLEPETVQNIPDELNAESSDISKKDNKNIDVPLKLILTEEDARKVAADIVEEVKYEALKRSPVRITREDVADETTSFFQVQPHEEQFNELHLIESIAAKKAEMQRNKLGMTDCQLSLEITDEDLKSSYAELSPIEHQMEKLRLMTEDDDPIKAYNEPSEADESESSIIIHDCLEESFTSGYDQANKMFNQTLDALKTTSLNKVERSIDTISEESTKPELEEIDPKKRKDDLTETAMQIIKEVTEKAIESETLKQVSSVKSNLAPHTDYKIKLIKDDLLKHERSLDVLMESSMTESVEECSAAESTRAYDSKFVTEFTKTTIPEMTEQEDVTVQKDRPLVQPEIVKMRKKSHIDEFNRRSGTDFDAYSSSGESHYFTAAEGTDSRSVSRPCSSDADLLLSATPGTSEYDTALTSQEGSQYTLSSQDFSTAPSSISSRDSMKSVDSESSGHLGSIELSSEASETLVPSTLDLEKDMELLDKEILEEEMMLSRSSSSNIPELTLFTGTPKSEELPSSMENDSDISEPSEEAMSPLVSSKMKRSMEMTFHPEPKVLLGEEIPITGLDESTISENSAITVIEIDKNILETSVSDTNMSSSNVSENIQLCTDTKNTSTENLPVASKVQGMDEGSTPNAVTITTTSVPSSDPDASKTTMCTQVTSEGNENSFFRTSGLAEIEKVSSQNGELIRRLAAAPATNEVGTAGSHSASPESLIIDSSKPEVDQYLEEDGISFSRKGMFFDEREDAYRNLSSSDPFERPKTPEPGSRSHLVLQSSEDTEDMTEVDKRFSAIFSVTYEEPESPSPLLKISSNSVPDITVTEHMAPVNEKHRYPDLESETEFPECFTQYGADSRTSTSPATSPKSSTTDSEHEREYCLEGQVSLPVDESFEFINVDDVYDTTEFQSTLMHHEHRLKDIAARNDRDESSDSGNIGDSPGILPVTIKAVKLDSLSPSDSENFGLDDMTKTLDDSAFNSSIEEQRRWLEMQFEENGIQSSYEFSQQNFGEHVFAGPLEDIEEERDDFERRDLSHVTKTPSLSSTPEYDVLAGRRFFTRSGDNDDISVSSLQEFETLEKVVSGEMGARRSSSGSQESLNGKQPGNGQKSAHGDDISVSSFSSLNEFERLEKECLLVEIEDKIKVEEQILSEIEEGHESQVSESESCETMSEAEEESPSNYEQKIFEIDEIIRQAQSNVENFEKEGVLLRDIVGISESTDERTPSAEPQDSLEEAAPSGEHKDKFEKSMAASTDSLESKSNMGTVLKKPDQMSASMDSLESARRDLMATSADSLGKDDSSGRDGDVSSGSERIYHRQGGPMEWSTDSLEPTSSQATHALCHYETDSMMSGSFTSGCSNTLMPTAEESSEFMSSGIYLQEGDFTEDYSDSKYDWRSGSFTEGLVREIVEESTEPEFSHTLTRTVVMPPKIEKVTFKGQDAEQQLEKYIEQFNVGEHSSETETVDAAGNVHIQRVVHKRMIIDPDVARETGLFSDTPEAPKGEPVNVESNVDQTVISISSMGIDAGKPVINTKILTSTLPSSSHISISPLSTHPSGPPSGLHSPREPPPTSLEPNTASEYSLDESTQEESK